MKYYPIQKQFVTIFKEKEQILLNLIKENSFQLNVILERIDICDFSMRCLHFYNSDEYELKNNTIIYTNQINKEKTYCCIQNNMITLSSLKGFDLFIERYFYRCFCSDDDLNKAQWFPSNTYQEIVEKP